MALRIRLARGQRKQAASGGLWKSFSVRQRALIALGCLALLIVAVCGSVFGYYYYTYRSIVDQRLEKPLFVQTAKIYAAPEEVRVGQKMSAQLIANLLRNAGYTGANNPQPSQMGTFDVNGTSSISVHPGPHSYHSQQGATIAFSGGQVSGITGDAGQALQAYELEPELITGLSEGANRTKRRLVTYSELPPNLVNAVVSIEDRRFFEHGGVDYIRLLGALRDDLRLRRRREGGSTLTMQLARGFFLSPEKKMKRKIIEIAITFQLEHRFTKQQIFQMYANQINLGHQGSFDINGFGQAAQTYFGKDVRELTLPECALLAGMIQHPSYLNPYRHPQRAIKRRNVVLDAMVDTGRITRQQAEEAKAQPLGLVPSNVDAGEAPYFVDLVRDRLIRKLGDADFNREGLRIYTSLDPDLQQAAAAAVAEGMKRVDAEVEKLHERRVKRGDNSPIVYPQVALVALNPHTGQVLALVGGRNYGLSQLNHAIASRPTGSIFKPFVYAAAFNTAVAGVPLPNQTGLFSPVTILDDQQTTYDVGGQQYTPRNFEGKYYDEVTARVALMKSLNNATIALAQAVGFNNVAALAREAGISSARGTPSVAIGAYDATPIEMAGAYTVFANNGIKIDPWMVASIRSPNGDVISDFTPVSKPVLDPRVAYLTTSMMEAVINHGTGAGVRAMGFTAPAAGKTGTSHDAWFAGYTSNLLCVVWVGNDDYSDIKIEGAHAAAPIWALFMKKAVKLPQYSDTKEFIPPDGVSIVWLDKTTNLIADSACATDDYPAAFLNGTAPTDTCDHSNGDQRNLFQKLFGIGGRPTVTPGPPQPAQPGAPHVQPGIQPGTQTAAAPEETQPAQQKTEKKKRGFFGKIFGALKGGDDGQKKQPEPAPQSEPQD